MKIINSNQNIEWRKLLSGKNELKTIIKFDNLLKKQSFKGLQKINKILDQKNIEKLFNENLIEKKLIKPIYLS
mgnify:CR=1 FL=1